MYCTLLLQDDHETIMKEVLQDYLGKAEAFRADLNDKRLTVEHMVLAMAEVQSASDFSRASSENTELRYSSVCVVQWWQRLESAVPLVGDDSPSQTACTQ